MENSTREFNRLIGNLIELHRRVFDADKEYPRNICANWFVEHLIELMQNSDFKSRLTAEQVNKILNISIDLLRTKLLDTEYNDYLIDNVRELRNMKKQFECTMQV